MCWTIRRDLIAVPGQHDPLVAARVQDGDDVAVAVGADLVGKLRGPGPHDVLDGVLEARGAGRVQQVFQKSEGGFLHNCRFSIGGDEV